MAAKTVMITGANRGLGFEFAKHYVSKGWKVIASARNVDTADELKALSPWKLVQVDTSNEESILAVAKELEAVPVDLLINNAGVALWRDLMETTKEDLLHQFNVNTVGPFLMTRALTPNLKLAVEANGEAFVVQMTSRMGSITDNTSGGSYGYRASKASLNMLSVNLAMDLAPAKIGVLILHPGMVATEMTGSRGITAEASVENLTKVIAGAKLEDAGKFTHAEGYSLQW